MIKASEKRSPIDETERMYMTYEKFLDCLEQELLCHLREGEQIRRVEVLKNNSVRLDGFSYQMKNRKEQPTVYVNHYYRKEIDMVRIREIADTVLKIQRESRKLPENELNEVLHFERMKDQIFYRLVSRERNRELLERTPHVDWLDLSLVFYLRIPDHIIKNATALISRTHMERWEKDEEDLLRTASENMRRSAVFFHPLEQLLDDCGMECPGSGMYVLSNSRKEFGAAVIVDQDIQKMCAERLGQSYYIIPSSIHEVILLPADQDLTRSDLDAMIRDVNRRCVSREEYLSNHAYYYDAEEERLKF